MREVSDREATRLIGMGAAGWYAIDANPPIPHATLMVVSVGDKNYLCTAAELKVTPLALVLVGEVLKLAFAVEIADDAPIGQIIKDQLATKPQIDIGVDIETIHTGDRQGI